MTHQHTNYWPTVCVYARDVPLLKCQIQYQWGIQTLSGSVMKTCKGAKTETEEALTWSLAKDFLASFSVLILVDYWENKKRLCTINLNLLWLHYQIIATEVKQWSNYALGLLHMTRVDTCLSDTHSVLLLLLWLTEFIVQIQHLSNVSWLLCQSESAAQLATCEYKTGDENQLLFSSCHV